PQRPLVGAEAEGLARGGDAGEELAFLQMDRARTLNADLRRAVEAEDRAVEASDFALRPVARSKVRRQPQRIAPGEGNPGAPDPFLDGARRRVERHPRP